jgi:hypothetical protein
MEVDVQRHALAALPSEKGSGTHFTGGWVGLDECGVWPRPKFECRTVQPVASSYTD